MFQDDCLEGRVALITGASAGIGRAMTETFAKYGADVAVGARRAEKLETLVDELEREYGIDGLPVPTDIRDPTSVDEMVAKTVDRFGGLDILVCNAGVVGQEQDVEKASIEEYRKLMETNVDGTVFTVQSAISHLRESNGNVLFMGSFAGLFPRPPVALYSSTKWWLRGFVNNLSAAEGQHGVGVTLINPSTVRSEVVPPFGNPDGETLAEMYGRDEVFEPDDMANAAVFAALQRQPGTVHEMNMYMRDWYEYYFE